MLIRRNQLERDPRWHNAQRRCVKPARLQTKSVCRCAFTHTNATEAYCPSCIKRQSEQRTVAASNMKPRASLVWFWGNGSSKCFKCDAIFQAQFEWNYSEMHFGISITTVFLKCKTTDDMSFLMRILESIPLWRMDWLTCMLSSFTL